MAVVWCGGGGGDIDRQSITRGILYIYSEGRQCIVTAADVDAQSVQGTG